MGKARGFGRALGEWNFQRQSIGTLGLKRLDLWGSRTKDLKPEAIRKGSLGEKGWRDGRLCNKMDRVNISFCYQRPFSFPGHFEISLPWLFALVKLANKPSIDIVLPHSSCIESLRNIIESCSCDSFYAFTDGFWSMLIYVCPSVWVPAWE